LTADFECDYGGPIVAQIASPITMAVTKTALVFPMFSGPPDDAFAFDRGSVI